MERRVWKHQPSDTRIIYRFVFIGDCLVKVRDVQGEQQVLGKQERELYRLGAWLAESFRGNGGLIVSLLCQGQKGSQAVLEVQKGTADVGVHLLKQPQESRTFPKTAVLEIEDGVSIAVTAEDGAFPAETASGGQKPEEPGGGKTEEPSPGGGAKTGDSGLKGEKPGTTGGRRPGPGGPQMPQEALLAVAQAEQARRAVEEARKKAGEALAQAQAELEEERRRNAGLRTALGAHLEALLSQLEPEKERLGTDLAAMLDRAKTAEASLAELRGQLEEARRQGEASEEAAAGLQKELEQLRAVDSARNLDCRRAQGELEELRAVLEADGCALTLLGEEPFLDTTPVERQLEDLWTSLSRAEEALGRAVRLQEERNERVKKTVETTGALSPEEE